MRYVILLFFSIIIIPRAATACNGFSTADCPPQIQAALQDAYDEGKKAAEREEISAQAQQGQTSSIEIDTLKQKLRETQSRLREQLFFECPTDPGPAKKSLLSFEERYPAMVSEVQQMPNTVKADAILQSLQRIYDQLLLAADAEEDAARYKKGASVSGINK